MPQLPTYDAPLGALPPVGGRRASPEDFGSDVGAAVVNVARAGQKVYNDIENAESRKALVRSSEVRAKYAKRLDEAALSGADLQSLKQEMNDELSKVGDDFATPQGHEQLQVYTANTNLMFDEQSNAIAVRRARSEAKLQAASFLNSGAEILQIDPTYLSVVERNSDVFASTLTGLSVQEKAEIASELKGELNVAAAMVSARMFPEQTQERLEAGAWQLTREQRDMAVRRADQTIEGRRIEETRKKKVLEDEAEAARETTRKDFLQRLTDNTLSVADVLDSNLKTTGEGSIPTYLAMIKARISDSKDPVVTDSFAFSAMLRQIRRGEITSQYDIEKRYTEHRDVSWTDVEKLRKEYDDMLTPDGKRLGETKGEFIKAITPQLDKSNFMMGFIDQTGKEQVYRMNDYMEQRIQAKRDKKEDPYVLFDPASTEYLGRSVHLFRKTIEESARELSITPTIEIPASAAPAPGAPIVRPAAPTPQPKAVPLVPDKRRRSGESIKDYDKRMKGGA